MTGSELVYRPVTDEEQFEYEARQQDQARREADDAELGVDLDVETIQERVFEARRLGANFDTIAKQFGFGSRASAWRAYQRYVKDHRTAATDVDTYLLEQLAEVEMVRRRVLREAMAQPSEARPFTFAAAALLKLQEREAWLVGMNEGQIKDPIGLLGDDDLD